MNAALSIIIPAHDEATVVGRCLDALARSPLADRLEVVVVANACTDDTVAVARSRSTSLPGLTVLDRPEPGKTGAMNAGDAVATGWPRVYLDADIVLSPDAVTGLARTLTVDEPLVAAPRIAFDDAGAARSVRMVFSVFARLPYVGDGLVGLGVFGLSRSGRARFEQFPDTKADDLFVQRLFPRERRITCAGTFTVATPRDLRTLVAIRTRVAKANVLLHAAGGAEDTTGSPVSALRGLARRPSMWPAIAVYAAVQVVARVRAPRSTDRWTRDETTRLAA